MNCGRCGAKLTIPEWAKYIKNKNNPDSEFSCGACGKGQLETMFEEMKDEGLLKSSEKR